MLRWKPALQGIQLSLDGTEASDDATLNIRLYSILFCPFLGLGLKVMGMRFTAATERAHGMMKRYVKAMASVYDNQKRGEFVDSIVCSIGTLVMWSY